MISALSKPEKMVNRLPPWLKQELPGALTRSTAESIFKLGINTVCRQAICPNANECFSKGQATFIILGKLCTRSCKFCNISDKNNVIPTGIDHNEPKRLARLVEILGLKYVVVTSVTRDDLDDGGAGQFVSVIESIHSLDRDIKVEALIPDFGGSITSLKVVVRAQPFVLAHNLETVKRLYSMIRPEADYRRSLELLKRAKELTPGLITKSSFMLGLGETEDEVLGLMKDLRSHDCDIITLGQYLAPSPRHYYVKEFISPEQFQKYYSKGMGMGFKKVLSGPKVRSSYQAEELSSLPLEQAEGLIYA